WLTTNAATLQERWDLALAEQRRRLSGLAARQGLAERGQQLLQALAELVPEFAASSTPDERFRTVLAALRRLQSEQELSTAEVVLLIFTLSEAVRATASLTHDGPNAPAATAETRQLTSLLKRLGLVFLELSADPAAEQAPQAESHVEYALRYERARQMAITDSLTGLHDFGYFRDRLSEERRRAERYQRLLSLIIFDLDHFKRFNDTYGHPAGNDVLRSVAAILKTEARETDLVARYGGEELVIVLPETNRKTAWDVAERIRARVEETPFFPAASGRVERVTLSAGVATFPVDAVHEDELVARADASLYLAKSSGRNRVVAYDPPHKVLIVYDPEPWVQHVALVGSFNNWDKDADPMPRRADGAFDFLISLNPGDYRYKFVLNRSAWTPDPKNPHTQPDNMGGLNSVRRVTDSDLPRSPPGPE